MKLNNQRKRNTDKCHLLFSKNYKIQVVLADSFIKSSNFEKLLALRFTKNCSFDEHVKNSSQKANNKLRVLARATPYVEIRKW